MRAPGCRLRGRTRHLCCSSPARWASSTSLTRRATPSRRCVRVDLGGLRGWDERVQPRIARHPARIPVRIPGSPDSRPPTPDPALTPCRTARGGTPDPGWPRRACQRAQGPPTRPGPVCVGEQRPLGAAVERAHQGVHRHLWRCRGPPRRRPLPGTRPIAILRAALALALAPALSHARSLALSHARSLARPQHRTSIIRATGSCPGAWTTRPRCGR